MVENNSKAVKASNTNSFCSSALRKSALMIGAMCLTISNAQAQQVALLDSGVDPNRGFNIAPGFNHYLDNSDTTDQSDREGEGHGTVSARVASEAFSGEIVPLVVTDGDLTSSNEGQVRVARNAALSDALSRDSVRVVGITWGTSGVVDTSSPLIAELTEANKVVAIMAGNDVSASPNALSRASFRLTGVVIVGATDASGVLLPESNRAGVAANKYVALNGLPSSTSDFGGTSWAAARLSGIAGAVLLQNPNLTAAQVVDVILESAEDAGAAGVDEEYGRGIIRNAQQVLDNAIGTPTVPTDPTPPPPAPESGGGGGGGGAGAVLLVGGALAGALLLTRKPKTKLEKTLVLDSYGRTFQTDLTQSIEVNDGTLELNQFFHSFAQQSQSNFLASQISLPGLSTQVSFQAASLVDPRFDYVKYFAAPNDVGIEPEQNALAFSVASQLSQKVGLTSAYQINPDQEFGGASNLVAHNEFGKSAFLSGQSFGSVLSGFSPQANTSSLTYRPNKNARSSLKLGLVSVDESERFNQDSFSTIIEGNYQLNDNAGVSLQFGQIQENGSVLGGGGGGVFGVDNAVTYAVNLSGNLQVAEKFSVVGNYGVGHTTVESSDNSLLKDFSGLRSDWYSVGLIGNNVFRAKDQIGFAFSQPLKIQSGEVDYSIPTGRLADTTIGFDTERVNLSQTNATERSLEAYYRTMWSDKVELGGFMSYRQNPNHVSDNGDEAIVMATIRFWK